MRPRFFLPLGTLWLMTSALACDRTDVGQNCPQLLAGAQPLHPTGDASVTASDNIIGTGPAYAACDALTCVAAFGRQGMCTTPCLDDAGCPTGFACRSIQTLGPFANQTFCVWKTCQTRADCGGDGFCCTQIAGASPTPDFKQCAFATDARCP